MTFISFIKIIFFELNLIIKTKSPPTHKASEGEGGVGENRTLVQTSNQKAFYTLSFNLDFRPKARPETATLSLALSVSERI